MEVSIARLREAVRRAAAANEMPVPQGGVAGGSWQWLWYPPDSRERAFRVDVAAEPSERGLLVSGHSLAWNRQGERRPAGETWFSHFYSHEESVSDKLAADLTEPLRQAWQAVLQESAAGAQTASQPG
jgi:hypothetical protein